MAIRTDVGDVIDQSQDSGPYVTIYMGVSHHVAKKEADLIEFKDLIKAAKEMFIKTYEGRSFQAYEDQFNRVLEAQNLGDNSEQSIGVICDQDHLYQFYLPIVVENQVLVQDNLFVLPLIQANQYQVDYDLLHVQKNNFILYSVHNGLMTRLQLTGEVPSFDLKPEDEKKRHNELLEFYKAIDQYVEMHYSKVNHRPLLLFGAKDAQGDFRKVSKNPQLVDFVKLDEDLLDDLNDLRPLADTVNKAFKSLEDTVTVTKYEQAVAGKRVVTELMEVAKAANEGMISTLIITLPKADSSFATGTFDQTEDLNLLNDIAVHVMKYGGEIKMIEADKIKLKTPAAAIIGGR